MPHSAGGNLRSEREPTCYKEGTEPPFMLWSLGESPETSSKPTARLNGLELSTTPSAEIVENIFGKRHLAEDAASKI